ncbi:bifunctional 4-hydroxy-2-oxoglutarate aldolase/2-dehydro-3-deoxy-phosphogluconate aldolase [Tepidanaerobacter sp. EBM-49]|uniref:bifunctional 4-hydroxy-2-oxoglutarate aldolase/2-dehydro-3-deoxy-phosphogluconate aldolase n=1 Tax=Tepidanaerobacter sp. EBM-49 TaxID=1918504 RepID=UPI00257C679F|nr:bifunctional 4-hydroxy-2-oxoglutarate aldolase/2-dehydro-3-deoxy-phosphogluconate aldolase [Tepidanaerobacter sp. EBM-49]
MKNENNIIDAINANKIIAIIRGIDKEHIVKTAEALLAGGIKIMEITLNRSDAVESIEMLCKTFSGKMLLGAGTVLNKKQVEEVSKAGAMFIVSPNTDREVIEQTKNLNMVSIPGALTPSEIVDARKFGADFVKVFPAGSLGPNYIKAIRAPLDNIPLLAVGGIDTENMCEFLKAGVAGLGIGGNLVDKTLISSGKYDEIRENAAKYVKKLKEV